ncbi:MAG: UDP-N-acetylmuramate--L-alanine ligase [Planctomycetes bacterium]|nr:UDP-N-acetylmuramate--L-alanine ligase [Planctomycetota bacterium]
MTEPAARFAPAKVPQRHSRTIDFALEGRRIHCVGVGGCGLSGLARLLAQRGAMCSGSDSAPSELTEALHTDGIPVSQQQTADTLPDRCDLVIASAAIPDDHPELLAARQRGIDVISYAQALGMVQADRTGVSIAGTHGKSTTAAMLCHVLIECGLDPSFIVGATCPQIGGGSRTGSAAIPGDDPLAPRPGILVAEACEFDRSFLHHRPVIALINNVDEDHLDVYGTLDAVVEAFGEFAKLLPPVDQGGQLLIAHDGAHRQEVTADLHCAVETFGFNPAADFHVEFDPAQPHIVVHENGAPAAQWTNAMPGKHNALNAAAAAILANYCGADWTRIATALGSFQGLDRRMQRLGARPIADGEVIVYDDYGHHPAEIEATLQALRAAERPRRLICVFQPHQHSRTRFLLDEFARSFSCADVVIVPHIYFVRDTEIEKQRVSAADLVDRLRRQGVTSMHIYPFQAIVEQLENICKDGDLVVIMGAGPVWQVARGFLDREESSGS